MMTATSKALLMRGNVDLPDLLLRGVAYLQPRQIAQLDCLSSYRKGAPRSPPVEAMIVATVAKPTSG